MKIAIDFDEYYFKYLGVTKEEFKSSDLVFSSTQRDMPLNNCFFHPLIVTNIEGNNIFSIAPKFYQDFKNYIEPFINTDIDKIHTELKEFFDHRLENYSIRKMHRMTLEYIPKQYSLSRNVKKLTKEILIDNMDTLSMYKKEKIWLRKKKEVIEGRQYVILDENKIVSYCKISNVDFGGGNIVVYTNEKYRKRGYGRLVTIGVLRWCYENNIIPIYWVDEKNIYSIKLAESLGFKIKSKEIVIGSSIDI